MYITYVLIILPYFSFFLSAILQQEIPYIAKEDFEVKLDYQFRQRPRSDLNTIHLADSRYERTLDTGGVLPYLNLYVKLLKLPEEKMRVRISRNVDGRTVTKRITVSSVLEVDMGFTDDMKDRVTAYAYTLYFLTSDKEIVSKIFITIDQEGAFFVNGEKRGAF